MITCLEEGPLPEYGGGGGRGGRHVVCLYATLGFPPSSAREREMYFPQLFFFCPPPAWTVRSPPSAAASGMGLREAKVRKEDAQEKKGGRGKEKQEWSTSWKNLQTNMDKNIFLLFAQAITAKKFAWVGKVRVGVWFKKAEKNTPTLRPRSSRGWGRGQISLSFPLSPLTHTHDNGHGKNTYTNSFRFLKTHALPNFETITIFLTPLFLNNTVVICSIESLQKLRYTEKKASSCKRYKISWH